MLMYNGGVKQGTSDEMGHRPCGRQRLLPPRREALPDAESGLDGYGEYLDQVVLHHQTQELSVRLLSPSYLSEFCSFPVLGLDTARSKSLDIGLTLCFLFCEPD